MSASGKRSFTDGRNAPYRGSPTDPGLVVSPTHAFVFLGRTRCFDWIIISLVIKATPAFSKFGMEFVWRVEWDIINEEFGAAIAILALSPVPVLLC